MNSLLVFFLIFGTFVNHNVNGSYQNNTSQNSYGGTKGYQSGGQSWNHPNPSSGNGYQGYGNQRTSNPSTNVGYTGTYNTGINRNPSSISPSNGVYGNGRQTYPSSANGEYANFGQSKPNNTNTFHNGRPITGNTGIRYPNNMNYGNRNQFNHNPNGVYGTPAPQSPNYSGVTNNGRIGHFNQFRPNNTGYKNGVSSSGNIGGYGSGGQTYPNNGRFGYNGPINPNPAQGNTQQFSLNNNNMYGNGRQFGNPHGGIGGSHPKPNITSFPSNAFGVNRDWQNGNRGQSTSGNTGRYGNIGQFGSSPNNGHNREYQGSKGGLYPNLHTPYNG
nr:GATA zinc finger domain-containing protein 14-like [Leptinotarsa decemlineata]